MDDRTNGSSGGTGPQDNVPQEQVQTTPIWDTGGEKSTGDAIQDGIYQHVSDENAGAGADTPVNQNAASDDQKQPSAPAGNQETASLSHGGYREGLPASGATTSPHKTVDGEEGS
jgi:hypothetical protein